MRQRVGGFGAISRLWSSALLIGACLSACAHEEAREAAPAAIAEVAAPETATVLRDGVAVQARVMASAPDARGERLWWILGEGVAIHARAMTLDEAIERGDAGAHERAGANGAKSAGEDGTKSASEDEGVDPWSIASIGIGGGR